MALEFLEWTIGTSQLLRWHPKLVTQKQPHNHTVTWKVVVLSNTYEQLACLVSGFRNKSSEANLYVHRWSSNDELNVCMFEQRSLVFWTHSEQLSLPIATKGCLGFGTFFYKDNPTKSLWKHRLPLVAPGSSCFHSCFKFLKTSRWEKRSSPALPWWNSIQVGDWMGWWGLSLGGNRATWFRCARNAMKW